MVNLANRTPQRPYLGQGLSFPLRINQQGNLELSSEENNIKESIWLILLTRIGERVYRPDFGCKLPDLAFAPMNMQTLMLMRIFVQEALERWEPRIIVDTVFAEPDPTNGKVDILINYRLQRSYDKRSLIYPFYLKQEA